MVATIQQIIGKINPKLYAINGGALLKKYGSADKIPAEEVEAKSLQDHMIVYDSVSEKLEPIYFWIVDFMKDFDLKVEKLIDNFVSSPGSGHFGELGGRTSIMQQQGTKLLGDLNTVLRSILNIIYDLKEFKLRLKDYDNAKISEYKEAATLALKQIWLDKVDMQKGQGSIHQLSSGNLQFITLRDAFLAAKDHTLKDDKGNEIDLNDRVKRILRPRLLEFKNWIKESEIELRKRYKIEKTYLKSQVSSLKLYSRWAKPYLKAAQDLETMDVGRNPALVKLEVDESAIAGDLPLEFKKLKTKRDYYTCVLVDFNFRGIPSPGQQGHYLFGGRAEVNFRAYALSSEELKKLDQELDKSDVGDALRLIEGITEDSLEQLKDEIKYFLEEDKEEEPKAKDKSNPFLALIGHYDRKEKKKPKKEKKQEIGKIRPDNWIEKNHLRELASKNAKASTFKIFNIYKKAHGMASYE